MSDRSQPSIVGALVGLAAGLMIAWAVWWFLGHYDGMPERYKLYIEPDSSHLFWWQTGCRRPITLTVLALLAVLCAVAGSAIGRRQPQGTT